ncbi:MAG: heavy-metal-associated domain-containing protein [Vicinamibacterales bacterium]
MTHTVTLSVTGMTCGGCENAVTRALGRLPGVERVSASHAAHQVTITFDDTSVTLARIREGISALGYTLAEP